MNERFFHHVTTSHAVDFTSNINVLALLYKKVEQIRVRLQFD